MRYNHSCDSYRIAGISKSVLYSVQAVDLTTKFYRELHVAIIVARFPHEKYPLYGIVLACVFPGAVASLIVFCNCLMW